MFCSNLSYVRAMLCLCFASLRGLCGRNPRWSWNDSVNEIVGHFDIFFFLALFHGIMAAPPHPPAPPSLVLYRLRARFKCNCRGGKQ